MPNCPAIQDTTTDLKMGPSNIYRRSWNFLHWLRFQFNLSHHQLIKNELIESWIQNDEKPAALYYCLIFIRKMRHFFDNERRCRVHIWSAIFEKKFKTAVPQKRSKWKYRITDQLSVLPFVFQIKSTWMAWQLRWQSESIKIICKCCHAEALCSKRNFATL